MGYSMFEHLMSSCWHCSRVKPPPAANSMSLHTPYQRGAITGMVPVRQSKLSISVRKTPQGIRKRLDRPPDLKNIRTCLSHNPANVEHKDLRQQLKSRLKDATSVFLDTYLWHPFDVGKLSQFSLRYLIMYWMHLDASFCYNYPTCDELWELCTPDIWEPQRIRKGWGPVSSHGELCKRCDTMWWCDMGEISPCSVEIGRTWQIDHKFWSDMFFDWVRPWSSSVLEASNDEHSDLQKTKLEVDSHPEEWTMNENGMV
jgi:hypothetical protein